MSNLCDAPPPQSVDSLKAGDSAVNKYKYYFLLCTPCVVWCYIVPAITALFFAREKIWVPVEPLEILNEEAEAAALIIGPLEEGLIDQNWDQEVDVEELIIVTPNEFDQEIEVILEDGD